MACCYLQKVQTNVLNFFTRAEASVEIFETCNFFFRSRSLLLPSPSRYRFAYTALATLRPFLHSYIFPFTVIAACLSVLGIPLYKDAFSVDLELIFLASPAFAA